MDDEITSGPEIGLAHIPVGVGGRGNKESARDSEGSNRSHGHDNQQLRDALGCFHGSEV
jgi:hypothetical protein